ncbi:MAG: 2-C-methyl-D-erythritol 4-phosphate cytidylyltransferase [Deltaproteobacteria bacterium]|nr:2-C-methyl-D-erythritol 4-phosphate cytidylyltransferase [Deltaproteobacteria bacterium]
MESEKRIDGPVWALVPAAGSGDRFGAGEPKQFVAVAGRPLLHHSLLALWRSSQLQGLVVAVPPNSVQDPEMLPLELRGLDCVRVVAGGESRTESVRRALVAVDASCELVLVHDGARPKVGADLMERVIGAARSHGAAVPVRGVDETVKEVDGRGRVLATLDRDRLRLVQTPQGFRRDVLERAYAWLDAQKNSPALTDDAALVEASGGEVHTVEGQDDNRKVTVPADLQVLGFATPRVGFGYDVHKLVPDRELVLGGVKIPFELGLDGHSDADVATHALCDAILGAAGRGDIGRMFPDDDARWAGADSLDLLARVVQDVAEAGFRPSSVDLCIVAQQPKLASHLPLMAERLAAVLGLDAGAVGLKATTTEGLGFAGLGQGMAAYATAVLVAFTNRF